MAPVGKKPGPAGWIMHRTSQLHSDRVRVVNMDREKVPRELIYRVNDTYTF